MMGTSSTSVDNPVNAIASMLTDISNEQLGVEPEKIEAKVEEVEEKIETPDEEIQESASQSLEEDAPEMDAADEDPATPDEEDVDTLNNLAETLDVPVADLYALNVNLAEGDPMTLGGLKDFYETNKDIDDQRQTLKQREEDLDTQASENEMVPKISNELMQARAQVLSIQDQYNRTDWETLRQTDPGNYAALQQDFRTHFDVAKAAEATANDTVNTHRKQAAQLQQERLFEAMPHLKDTKVRAQALTTVNTFAAKYGFTAKEVDNIEDSRLIRLLIDASAFTTAKETVKAKMEDKTPLANKTAPGKSAPTSSMNRKSTLKRLTERAKASGDRRDQTSAVAALLNT